MLCAIFFSTTGHVPRREKKEEFTCGYNGRVTLLSSSPPWPLSARRASWPRLAEITRVVASLAIVGSTRLMATIGGNHPGGGVAAAAAAAGPA